MTRAIAIGALIFSALSCHRPRTPDHVDPTGDAVADLDIDSAGTGGDVVLASSPRSSSVNPITTKPRTRATSESQSEVNVDSRLWLCCDPFSEGLCYRAEPSECLTATPRSCDPRNLREIRYADSPSAWVCAEP